MERLLGKDGGVEKKENVDGIQIVERILKLKHIWMRADDLWNTEWLKYYEEHFVSETAQGN